MSSKTLTIADLHIHEAQKAMPDKTITVSDSQPTTLDRAIDILNAHKHRNMSKWEIKDNGAMLFAWNAASVDQWFDEFEATAIAEKYERDGAQG